MKATGELLAIAQVSVTLVGLSGLVSVFRARVVVNRRLSNAGFFERTPRMNRLTLTSASVAALLLALCAFGVFRPGPAAYLTALIVCLVMCLTYVVIMLIIRRRE